MSYHSKRKDANNYQEGGENVKTGTIYLITNTINDKKYVGQTIFTIRQRFLEHINYAKNGNNNHMPLAHAIKKYGEENFKIEELCKCKEEDLDKEEQYYIQKYNTFHNGYNATLGGANGSKIDIDLIEMIQLYHALKSARKVAEHYKVDKDTICNRLHSNGVAFYSLSEQRGLRVKVLKDEVLIKEFSSKIECAKWFIENNISRSKKIGSVRKMIFNTKDYFGYEIIVSDKI